ncbi:MAG: hypothetical protein SGI74_12810 [Oligoflexia bacterium]|nr:hypothetical protein [Oligoflexia bacterium]
MNKVTGLVVATAVCAMFASGARAEETAVPAKADAKAAKAEKNHCKNKAHCAGKGKNSCKGKSGCKGKGECKGHGEATTPAAPPAP